MSAFKSPPKMTFAKLANANGNCGIWAMVRMLLGTNPMAASAAWKTGCKPGTSLGGRGLT